MDTSESLRERVLPRCPWRHNNNGTTATAAQRSSNPRDLCSPISNGKKSLRRFHTQTIDTNAQNTRTTSDSTHAKCIPRECTPPAHKPQAHSRRPHRRTHHRAAHTVPDPSHIQLHPACSSPVSHTNKFMTDGVSKRLHSRSFQMTRSL